MTPLSPTDVSRLNIETTLTEEATSRGSFDHYEVHTRTETTTSGGNDSGSDSSSSTTTTTTASSHFVDDSTRDQENMPPSPPSDSSPSPPSAPATAIKPQRHSRVMSGTAPSPLKILAGSETSDKQARSPLRKTVISPDKVKRFPVRVSNPSLESARNVSPPPPRERTVSLDDVMHDNEGLKHAIEIFEDDDTELENDETIGDASTISAGEGEQYHHEMGNGYEDQSSLAHPDESMMSTFSAFSAVPNLTMFAKLGQTPTKYASVGGMTPRGRPETVHEQTPRQHSDSEGNSTNLLDFTASQRFPHKSPSRRGNTSPSRTNPNATPARQMSNLLDFDIPPLPTPRSIPTITPRELESLKSNFLSEISSLKASLSGKEAEVLSLKTAVGDAEKRVGESLEQAREERTLREQVAEEKEMWEKSSREMEKVLRSVKEEITHTQREREELESKLAECEGRREAAETMAQEAESKLASFRAGKSVDDKPSSPKGGAAATSKEVEIAVERVARELHALYKGKHETKVAALKKSYENRWEKKVRELEGKIEELTDENEKIRRDNTITRVDPAQAAAEAEFRARAVRDSAHIKELSADVERLEAVVMSVKRDNSELRDLLAQERVEKGELVQLAEEMMSIQTLAPPEPPRPAPTPVAARTPGPPVRSHTENNFRSSIGRGSGLKAPGSIAARGSVHERTGSNGPATKGLPRPRPMSEFGPRSGIMSSIEKMGNYRGRGD
ncbi:hypothetical protein ColTof4_00784 [Colletotrichum tofieldiae]|uniref:Kinetoplast-associated protein KAP n=1 Tax=Colletotrichum tofieldiae TaxID=708197 RepID=A0A161V3K8_9PEZI|nr:hypothetical protein CT0861_07748 [Colletotrichum tofieldiae]GKT68361.1 hypothetical protein ColTof4_00784 [Colletotrichum tofieldiae]GKT90623.1 hypothetical protein Ct61P_08473 [Colletotrichum tofieldiae]